MYARSAVWLLPYILRIGSSKTNSEKDLIHLNLYQAVTTSTYNTTSNAGTSSPKSGYRTRRPFNVDCDMKNDEEQGMSSAAV